MTNIILIGMPGAGKSTLGIQLAKETARDFLDTDVLIQLRENKSLQAIIDETDYLNLRRIEEAVLLSLACDNHVIATGGSAVYSDKGMAHLKSLGKIVFLDVSLEQLRLRVDNYEQRGVARRPDQSFDDLFTERRELYLRYADVVIDCETHNQSFILQQLRLC